MSRAEDEQDCTLPLPYDALKDRKRRAAMQAWLRSACGGTQGGRTQFEAAMQRLWQRRRGGPVERFVCCALLARRTSGFLAKLGQFKPLFRWCNRHRQLIEDLVWLIAWALTTGEESRFAYRPDLYDNVVRALSPLDGLAVITLNYDVLFEEAVVRAHGDDAIWYAGLGFGQDAPKRLPVYKLHGSCNWLSKATMQPGQNWPPELVSHSVVRVGPDGTVDTGQEYATIGDRCSLVAELKHSYGPLVHPVIGLYAETKPVPINWRAVTCVRDACAEAIRRNPDADVTVIGLHIPSAGDDPTLRKILDLFAQCTGKRSFVNPSAKEEEQARRLGFSVHRETLREYLRRTSHE